MAGSIVLGSISAVSSKTVSDSFRHVALDPSTHATQTIQNAHHEIHAGNNFYLSGYTTLEDGPGTLYIKLVTPDTTKWAHFVWSISSSGITMTTLTEDATGGMTGGSTPTIFNNNRNSSTTSGLVITSGVTVNTGGTIIDQAQWGASGFKEFSGGGNGRSDELVLKQNTTYLRAFTSYSAGNVIQFKASWYEHTDKD